LSKIGIITFHRAVNYGALLQAYALEKAIEKLGAQCEIIDYRTSNIEKYYYRKVSADLKPKQFIKKVLFLSQQKKRNRQFDEFTRKYLTMTKEVYSSKDKLKKVNSRFDAFITGSDQVWNYECTSGDFTYFLDFVEDCEKKNSYAASFGKFNLKSNRYDQAMKLLDSFWSISVREEVGRKFIQNNINKTVEVHIDPTFLLGKNEWTKIAAEVNKSEYILLYSVDLMPSVLNVARKMAKDSGLDLILITLRNNFIKLNDREYNCSLCSPEEFLGYIKNAKFVITNSFHGTALSIILNKEFYMVYNKDDGLDNSRLGMLLDSFLLSDRAVEYENAHRNKNIDYSYVNQRINTKKADAVEYLKKVVNKVRVSK